LRTQLASYADIFGGPPLSKRYLIVINEHESGDGGAFASSFSQFIQGDADQRNRVIWGYVMAHELLHFWNGLSFAPADHREEWFKEGATDYLTMVTLARNGWLDGDLLYKRLENVPRRYLIARFVQGLRMSVRDSGKDKQPNRQLVYGGGSLAALALDVALRERSGDKVGLPDFVKVLHAEFGQPGKAYALADLERIARQLTGSDFGGFFAEAVGSESYFDIRPSYAAIGLRMDSFVEEMFISHEPDATPAQRARFEAIFGRRPL
jgi:predicted metalloprotease with PDZ domain